MVYFFKSLLILLIILSYNLGCIGAVPEILEENKFSWIEPDVIAGMAKPKTAAQIKALADINIGLVVTLIDSDEGAFPAEVFKQFGIEQLQLPIPRKSSGKLKGMTPTLQQVAKFIKKSREVWEKNKKATVVHCYHGEGRTGTMLACWLVANKNMPPDQAVLFVRKRRPGSASYDDEVKFVGDYYVFLHEKELKKWKGENLLKKFQSMEKKHTGKKTGKSKKSEIAVAEFFVGIEEQDFRDKLIKLKQSLKLLNEKLKDLQQKILHLQDHLATVDKKGSWFNKFNAW